jgi:hypothetical protein
MRPVRALPMDQLMLAACSRQSPVATDTSVDVPERTSGRTPSPGTPHRPSRDRTMHGSRTQIRLGAVAHPPSHRATPNHHPHLRPLETVMT